MVNVIFNNKNSVAMEEKGVFSDGFPTSCKE